MTKGFAYFRFTSYQDSSGGLMPWFDWFEKLGIPCALVRHEENTHFRGAAYAVWRVGREHLSNGKGVFPNSEEFGGEILMEANDFRRRAGV